MMLEFVFKCDLVFMIVIIRIFNKIVKGYVVMVNMIRKEIVMYVIVFVWLIFFCRIFDKLYLVFMSVDLVDEGIFKFMMVFVLYLMFFFDIVVNDNWLILYFDF